MPDMPVITERRSADEHHEVVLIEGGRGIYRRSPCARTADHPPCPWRLDADPHEYPAEAFAHSARTAYDLAQHTFGCHQSPHDDPLICAGFLLRGAEHNLKIRMMVAERRLDPSAVHSDVELHEDYVSMAVAAGLDCDDPSLRGCRRYEQ